MELRESETFRNLIKAYEGELKASGKYRWRLIVKCRDTRRFRQMMGGLLRTFAKCPEYKKVTAYADMTPDKIL